MRCADRRVAAGLGAKQGDSVVGDLSHAIDSRRAWWTRLTIGHPRPPLTATVRVDW